MNRNYRLVNPIIASLLLLMLSAVSHAQEENPEHLLDGTNLNFFYQTGSGMNMSFDKGMARYEWSTGPRKGRKGQDIPYRSRKIGNDMYLVNWVQPDKPDFITLIFNFNNNTMYSSGLIGYGEDRQRVLFLAGILEHVER